MYYLIFGGSGFIGSHFIDELFKCYPNSNVINCDLIEYLKDNIQQGTYQNYILDVLDRKRVEEIVHLINPEVIVNFAGIANIRKCNDDPVVAVTVNIDGNLNILEAISNISYDRKLPRFVYASSLYVYNDMSGIYGVTKRASEELIKQQAEKYNFSYVILRYGTVYGNRSRDDNSIRNIVQRALKTKTIYFPGRKTDAREYIHVKDAARCTLEVINKKEGNKIVNITGLNAITGEELVLMMRDILGTEYKIEFGDNKGLEHYGITPYKFEVEQATKYIGREYIDLGAGLLEQIKINERN